MADNQLFDNCKLCNQNGLGLRGGVEYPNKEGKIDICRECCDNMKQMDKELVKDKVKFLNKIRCDTCNYRICKINSVNTCLWCLNSATLIRSKNYFNKYNGKSNGFVLYYDFEYCLEILKEYPDEKLSKLALQITNMHNEIA